MPELLKTDLANYNNAGYSSGKNVFIRGCWYITNVLFFLNPLNPVSGIKVLLLRMFGARVGKGVNVKPSVNIKYPWHLTIGNNVWIGENVWIDNLAKVEIGDNCCISQGALLLTGNHNYKRQDFKLMVGEILLQEGVWIGAKSIVGPGVKCMSHSVLSAGSFLSSGMGPYTIYAGNPAKQVRTRIIE